MSSASQEKSKAVLITGGNGYVGRLLVEELARTPGDFDSIVSVDVRDLPTDQRLPGVVYATEDVRGPGVSQLVKQHGIDCVVHLATIVSPGKDRQFEHSVDVGGTKNVLDACIQHGVRQLVLTSSGAAYGYHADSPAWLDEKDPLRGNPEFPYSDHKRLVEEMLKDYRERHPELLQLIFRPGTVLGAGTDNRITNLFKQRFVIGLSGVDSPFVFIWDRDVVGAIAKGVREGGTGIFNLAGDGIMTMREVAKRLGKPYLPLPTHLVEAGLWALHKAGVTHYGPEQLLFLKHRPVLSNRRLKNEFGYMPKKTTREVFETYLAGR